MTWMQTYTGRDFDLQKPDPDSVDLEDIGRSLSGICRYTAHTSRRATFNRVPCHYSVAQHCVLMAREAAPEDKIHMLLHDAGEAYHNDLPTPIKWTMPPDVRMWWEELQARVDVAIYRHFHVGMPTMEQRKRIKECDLRMLVTEAQQLMVYPPPKPWRINAEPYNIDIVPWHQDHAEALYIDAVKRELWEVL